MCCESFSRLRRTAALLCSRRACPGCADPPSTAIDKATGGSHPHHPGAARAEDLPFPHVSLVFSSSCTSAWHTASRILLRRRSRRRQPGTGQAHSAVLAVYVREQWSIDSLTGSRHLVSRLQSRVINPIRSQGLAAPQPRNRAIPHRRTHRRHRSHSMAGLFPWTAHSTSSDSPHDRCNGPWGHHLQTASLVTSVQDAVKLAALDAALAL